MCEMLREIEWDTDREKEEGRNETEVFTDNLIYPQEVYMSSQKKIYNGLSMTSTKDYIWS